MHAWSSDASIDDTYIGIYKDLLKIMSDDPDSIAGCSHLLSIAKNIERLGDYAQNIAEDIHFIITGSAMDKKSS